jgi:hypothetical protein
MTHGAIEICHVAYLIEYVQIKFKSIFKYVGWTKYLPTYIFTYPSRLNNYLDKTYLPT